MFLHKTDDAKKKKKKTDDAKNTTLGPIANFRVLNFKNLIAQLYLQNLPQSCPMNIGFNSKILRFFCFGKWNVMPLHGHFGGRVGSFKLVPYWLLLTLLNLSYSTTEEIRTKI